jgi:hypothetical protein
MYTSLQSCENGAFSVTENSRYDSRFERLQSKDGKFYFTLKGQNGEIIGTSEMYEAEAGRENGIRAVKENSVAAGIGMI